MTNTEQLKITLTRGLAGKTKKQISVVRALGLGKHGSSVVHTASPTITGMIRKVEHLLSVCQAEGAAGKASVQRAHRSKNSSKVKQEAVKP